MNKIFAFNQSVCTFVVRSIMVLKNLIDKCILFTKEFAVVSVFLAVYQGRKIIYEFKN